MVYSLVLWSSAHLASTTHLLDTKNKGQAHEKRNQLDTAPKA